MDMNEAREILGVGDVFTYAELKAAFRAKSMIAHPDMGGDNDAFIRLQEAYDIAKGLAKAEGIEGLTTAGGRPLSDLGKGYPLTEAAKTCGGCDGLGYRKYSRGTMEFKEDEPCPDCETTGLFSKKCSRCGGDGVFRNPRTGKTAGKCFGCGGTGKFYPWNSRQNFSMWEYRPPRIPYPDRDGDCKYGIPCRTCEGHGHVTKEVVETVYGICDECGGVGEIKMWNPVLHRGLLAAMGK